VIKYLVISGCVTVTGPPARICFVNKGITEPRLPSTLPNLTATNFVLDSCWLNDWTTISAIRFDAPIIFVGFTALSVDTSTNEVARDYEVDTFVLGFTALSVDTSTNVSTS